MSEEKISGSLQENLLCLLCFSKTASPIIANSVEPGLFESDIYKDIATQAIDYFNQFKTPCGEHIADLLESRIYDKKNPRLGDLYKDILISIYETKDSVNEKYVLTKLSNFVRLQKFKSALVEAVKLTKDGDIDAAQSEITKSFSAELSLFDPGTRLSNPTQSLRFFNETVQPYKIGIEALDRFGYGPAPGELYLILAPANRGKTWFLINSGKYLALQRLKVCHISLEMSEEKTSQRYIQNLYSLGKRDGQVTFPSFVLDEMGRMTRIKFESLDRPTIKDEKMEEILYEKVAKLRTNLFIKRFPTNALSIKGLETYLDSMERHFNFTPDVLIIDYADLMKMNSQDLRIATGELYKDIRRIAVERNIAGISASQANRLSEDVKVITLKYLAEDYSKAATADTIIAYCQTSPEYKLGLARLFVAKARDEEREQTAVISQAYRIGQFCMNSVMTNDEYWTQLKNLSGNQSDDTENQNQTNVRKPREKSNENSQEAPSSSDSETRSETSIKRKTWKRD